MTRETREYYRDLPFERQADARGECDRCHEAPIAVWTDDMHAGEYQYCRECLTQLGR